MLSRLFIIFILLNTMLFTSSLVTLAQDDPEPPLDDIPVIDIPQEITVDNLPLIIEEINEAIIHMEEVSFRAEQASIQAQTSISHASDLFGLFEAMSGAVGLVVPFLAVVGGLLGFRRLNSAETELKEARKKFEADVKSRGEELDNLRDELKASVDIQRSNASKTSLALSLLPLGDRQYRAQDYRGALDTYQRALKLDENNPVTQYRIGYVYTQSGELDKAEAHMRQSLELDPDLSASRAALGYIYRRMGDALETGIKRDLMYNKAEQNFLQALDASPRLMDEDGEAWWGALGGLYRRRNQIEQAIYAYERGTEVTPHSSYPFSNLALLYMQTHNRAKMLKTYERVEILAAGEIQGDPRNYWAYADLITSRLALGKIDEARAVLRTGLETAPVDSPYTLDSLIETLQRLMDELEDTETPPIVEVIHEIQEFKRKREKRATQEVKVIPTTMTIDDDDNGNDE